jgi:hypothetical protein
MTRTLEGPAPLVGGGRAGGLVQAAKLNNPENSRFASETQSRALGELVAGIVAALATDVRSARNDR